MYRAPYLAQWLQVISWVVIVLSIGIGIGMADAASNWEADLPNGASTFMQSPGWHALHFVAVGLLAGTVGLAVAKLLSADDDDD